MSDELLVRRRITLPPRLPNPEVKVTDNTSQLNSDNITQDDKNLILSRNVTFGPLSPKSLPFDQSHHRVTTYLQQDIFVFISKLRQEGNIKVTQLYNQALTEYLTRYYGYSL